jgi:hypothetical protein
VRGCWLGWWDGVECGGHVDETMPRSWFPIIMEETERGRVVVLYLSQCGKSIKIGDVTGGKGESYDVVVAPR